MIAFAELPEGVALLRVYAKKGALTGACLIECHHADGREICSVCRSKEAGRPVKLLCRIPAAALKAAPREPVQPSLF